MKRLAVLALAAAAAAALPAPSHALPPAAHSGCGYAAVPNAFDPSGTRWTGEVEAGPLVIGDQTGRVRCVFVVGSSHIDRVVASAGSVTTGYVLVLPPTPIEFRAGDSDIVALCTQAEIDGDTTYYWDADANAWSTSPAVTCIEPLG